MEYVVTLIVFVAIAIAAGKHLAFHVLGILTALSMLGGVLLWRSPSNAEFAQVGVVLILLGVTAFNIIMWVSYYDATGQTWVGEFVNQYILR